MSTRTRTNCAENEREKGRDIPGIRHDAPLDY
jgi:hypothetical protein